MVRLVPSASGLPGQSPALAAAMPPHSASGNAKRKTILASPEPMPSAPNLNPGPYCTGLLALT